MNGNRKSVSGSAGNDGLVDSGVDQYQSGMSSVSAAISSLSSSSSSSSSSNDHIPLAKLVLSLDGRASKLHALRHLLTTLHIFYARYVVCGLYIVCGLYTVCGLYSAVQLLCTLVTVQYNTKRIYNVPISPSKKPESEAREVTVTGSDEEGHSRSFKGIGAIH